MREFPEAIVQSMLQSGAMTTCVPVAFDQDEWESAVFFELGGKECDFDRQILSNASHPFSIKLEAELIEHARAGVVMLRFEVLSQIDDPLVGEVLIVPGLGDVQFDTLKLLTRQKHLKLFFADERFKVIYSQQLVLSDRERLGYGQILEQAINHDALIRLTGKYDAMSALTEIVDHYDVRVP